MKQLINNACQFKLQSGVFGVTYLFINYNIKANRNALENHFILSYPEGVCHYWSQYA